MFVAFLLIGLTVGLIVLFFFVFWYLGSINLAPEERSDTAIFSEQCGGQFDSFNLTIPFVRFAVYKTFVVAAYGRTIYLLPFSNVQEIIIQRHFISRGIHFKHNKADVPKSFIIWSKNTRKLTEVLNSTGIKVKGN
ncbi:MAG: hypothetical protein HQM08_24355 [Candidatus Riflebacteria bacterium]|nr:hypothetical protein [Candidatus Riflebacteria bacterium]